MARGIGMVIVAGATLLLGACWNGGNDHFVLGDVSLGQQMIDLKSALDQGAVTEAEYERMKQALLAFQTACAEPKGE